MEGLLELSGGEWVVRISIDGDRRKEQEAWPRANEGEIVKLAGEEVRCPPRSRS